MPLTLAEKQTLFINELVLDFEANVKKLNDENRNRSDAREGFVQSTVNQTLGLTSNISTLGLVASTVASAGLNKVKGNKQERRREGITAQVTTELETTIHDAIKVAARKLFMVLRDFLAETADASVKIIADCISDRMINYLSKITDGDSTLDLWSVDNFMLGAFLGRSGRFKQGAFNTTIERENEEITWLKSFLNANASTVEGLLAHSAWACKDATGHWVYSHFKKENPFKYGLLVVPAYVMEATVKNRFAFEPSDASLLPYQARLESDWTAIQEELRFVPTKTNDALSETLAEHQQDLNEMRTIVAQLEEQVKASSTYQEEMSNIIAAYYDNAAQKRWERLKTTTVNTKEEAVLYAKDVNAWLSDLSDACECDLSEMVELLSRVALCQYPEDKKLVLTPKEKAFFKDTPEVFRKPVDFIQTHFMEDYFPVLFTKPSFQWNSYSGKALQGYFQAMGLWLLYENADNDWSLPALWTNFLWEEEPFIPFISVFQPSNLLTQLAKHWCQTQPKETDDCLRENITVAMKNHVESCHDFACGFCQTKKNFSEHEQIDKQCLQSAPLNDHTVRFLLPVDFPFTARHIGFSPEQPTYPHLLREKRANRTWARWAEDYLAQIYYEATAYRIHHADSLHEIATLSPLLLLIQQKEKEQALIVHEEAGQLLRDEKTYIDALLQAFRIESIGGVFDTSSLIMTYIEAQKIFSMSYKKILDDTKEKRLQLSHPSTLTPDDFLTEVLEAELIYPLADFYGVLQSKEKTASLDLGETAQNLTYLKRNASTESKGSLLATHQLHRTIANRDINLDAQSLELILADLRKNTKDKNYYLNQLIQLKQNKIPAGWERPIKQTGIRLSQEEIELVLNAKINLLRVRLLVIECYLYGSGMMCESIIADPELMKETNPARLLTKRHSESASASSPPLDLSPIEQFSERPSDIRASMDVKPAFSAYELLARTTLFEAGYFWQDIKERFAEDRDSFQSYQEQLAARLARLPKVESLLFKKVGKKRTAFFEEPLKKWAEILTERKAVLENELRLWEAQNEIIVPQRTFHESGEMTRFNTLLDYLCVNDSRDLKRDFDDLPSEERVFIEENLSRGNINPAARWFSLAFEQYRVRFFKAYFNNILQAHFHAYFETATLGLSDDTKKELNNGLNQGKFKEAMSLISALSDQNKLDYFHAYGAKCQEIFNQYHETCDVFSTLREKNDFLLASFETGDISLLITKMRGRWHLLSPHVVKQLIQQGLHPDATLREKTLLDVTMEALTPFVRNTFASSERVEKLQRRVERLYYFLNTGTWVNNWPLLFSQINSIRIKAAEIGDISTHNELTLVNPEQLIWSRLLAALQLFEQFSNNPELKEKATNALITFNDNINAYWAKFEKEQHSWRYKIFGSFYRKDEVIKHRTQTYEKLKHCHETVPLYYSHLYLYLDFFNQIIQSTERQYFNSSRLKDHVRALQNQLEQLVGNWETLKPLANEATLTQTHRGFAPTSHVLTVLPTPAERLFAQEAIAKAEQSMKEKLEKTENRAEKAEIDRLAESQRAEKSEKKLAKMREYLKTIGRDNVEFSSDDEAEGTPDDENTTSFKPG
jgi:hypothetical protein